MKIVNGICKNVESVKFVEELIPQERIQTLKLITMHPLGICIHNFGSDDVARDVTEYVDTTQDVVAWHFTVGDGIVYQELPINLHGLHAGDGRNGIGNSSYIGIEIEESPEATRTAQKFIYELMIATGITLSYIKPHKSFSGKICPGMILPMWDSFIAGIKPDKHWAEDYFNYLNANGLDIKEKRFDEPMKRGEVFKLLTQILKGVKENGKA